MPRSAEKGGFGGGSNEVSYIQASGTKESMPGMHQPILWIEAWSPGLPIPALSGYLQRMRKDRQYCGRHRTVEPLENLAGKRIMRI